MATKFKTLKTDPIADGEKAGQPDLAKRQTRLVELGTQGWKLNTSFSVGNIIIDTLSVVEGETAWPE